MAIPSERQSTVCSLVNVALIGLCLMLAATTALRQGGLTIVAHTAVAGLAAYDLIPRDVLDAADLTAMDSLDAADLPAMDPLVARVVDPRPTLGWAGGRSRGTRIEPFQYDLQSGESLAVVAARFGVPLSALLWNNGLQAAEQAQPGQRLLILPMNGLLHHVRPGETAREIAGWYGVAASDLAAANALDDTNRLVAGQTLVVPGGIVPMVATTSVAESAAIAEDVVSVVPAQVAEPSYEERVAAAIAWPDQNLPQAPNATASQREFIRTIGSGARESQRVSGIPSSVTLAQAILESDWGRSRLAREAKNLFGIKAHKNPGTAGLYRISTWEVFRGISVITPDVFRAYHSFADSIIDHGRWFHTQPRYGGALAVRDDPGDFVRAISAAGYATDPAYAAKLIGLMDRFNLYAYDLD